MPLDVGAQVFAGNQPVGRLLDLNAPLSTDRLATSPMTDLAAGHAEALGEIYFLRAQIEIFL